MIQRILKAKNLKDRIEFFDLESLQNVLMNLPDEVEVVLRKESQKRSLRQNNYLHGVIFTILGEELGYTVEEVKDICKSLFLREYRIIKTEQGEKNIPIIRHTSSLTTGELEKFTEQIRIWASSELGIFLPLPNEVNF